MGLFDQAMKASGEAAESAPNDNLGQGSLDSDWTRDIAFVLDRQPQALDELKECVDVANPASVAAHWVYCVSCLTADSDIAMDMMRYLFADLEPFGRGFTEGGLSGKAGWDSYLDERLRDDDYRWLPRAYFDGASADNGFHPASPLMVQLHYNEPNTQALNAQSLSQLGRLNIVYYVESNAAGNKVNIELARFEGSGRFYVTNGAASAGLFYDQRSALTAEARAKLWA